MTPEKKNILQNKVNLNSGFRHRMPSDLQIRLQSNKVVSGLWEKLTPLSRNEWICWVTSPKTKETRMAHLKRLEEDLLKGKKRPCCWPGCSHRMVS